VVDKRPVGRRPGGPDTRGEILTAARAEFSAKGFDRTTVRGVAAAAGVDSALVHHYFGAKEDLFLAALEFPFDPRVVIPAVIGDGPEGLGERIATTFLAVWDDPDKRLPLLALLRSAISTESGADMMRSGVAGMILGPIVEALGLPDGAERAQLVVSQLLGLAVVRYALAFEPLASMPAADVVRLVAPNLQRYLTP
jgi:AcrR family transcriptional regulator